MGQSYVSYAPSPEVAAVARRYRARFVEFFPSFPDVLVRREAKDGGVGTFSLEEMRRTYASRPGIYRFLIFQTWVQLYGSSYKRVGWVDSGDVFFQRDPFEDAPCAGQRVPAR